MSMVETLIDNPALLDSWISHDRALPAGANDLDMPAMAERRAMIARHVQAMDSLSSDHRIRYLSEHGFADADIHQLLGDIQRVINREYGATIRQMAAEHARQGNGLADVVADICNTNLIHDLAVVCYRKADESDVIAAAYANHEFYYTVNAALNVAMMSWEPTDEETALDSEYADRDRMLADIGLTEDVRLWPKS